MNKMNKELDTLAQLGFEIVGEWFLENDALDFKIDKHKNEFNILYAFVSNNKIKYIGKSTNTLGKRIYQYKKPGPSQKTNIKNNKNIKKLLISGQAVQIWAFPNQDKLYYREFPINIAAGLEDNLIAFVKPDWNDTGK